MNNEPDAFFMFIVILIILFLGGCLHQALGPEGGEVWYGMKDIKPSDQCVIQYKWKDEWKDSDLVLPTADAYRFKLLKKVEK